jgi:peptidoglycan hydrolase-like protein with peptidoglycan-binding domain
MAVKSKSSTIHMEVTMKNFVRNMALGAASMLAISGAFSASAFASAANSPNDAAKLCPSWQSSVAPKASDLLRRDDIRWAQTELRFRGLYNGPLDGVLGPATEHALARFQHNRGLERTAALDAKTWAALTGEPDNAEGSSLPPSGGATNSSRASALGR